VDRCNLECRRLECVRLEIVTGYVARRVIAAIPSLVGISVILFAIIHLGPGDPLSVYGANPNITPEVRAQIMHQYGLDLPLPLQYARWASGFIVGDWGTSYFENRPVNQVVLDRLPTTLLVMGLAFVISLLLAVPIGVVSAIKQYSVLDHLLTTVSFLGISVPSFFSGLVLIIIFGVELKWLPFVFQGDLPITGPDAILTEAKQLVLPLAVLALYYVGIMARYVRSALLEVMHQEYVRTARAKGLPERSVLALHCLRNALQPVITLVALNIPGIFTGAIITEQIFSIPGVGRLLVNSITNSDYLVVMAIVFLYAVLMILCNLVADVAYAVVDPRVSYG
jgi:peptide/nickel transport system permease protein